MTGSCGSGSTGASTDSGSTRSSRSIKRPDAGNNPPEVAQTRTRLGQASRTASSYRPARREDTWTASCAPRSAITPEPLLLGEAGVADPERWAAYYGDGDELMLTLNFAFWSQPWSAAAFHDVIATTTRLVPDGAWPVWALGNHDIMRLATRYDQDGRGPSRARLAAMMLLTLRGTPLLYYGDEIGMTNVAVPPATPWISMGATPCAHRCSGALASTPASRPRRRHGCRSRTPGPERQRDRPAGGPGFTLEPLPRPARTATFDTCAFWRRDLLLPTDGHVLVYRRAAASSASSSPSTSTTTRAQFRYLRTSRRANPAQHRSAPAAARSGDRSKLAADEGVIINAADPRELRCAPRTASNHLDPATGLGQRSPSCGDPQVVPLLVGEVRVSSHCVPAGSDAIRTGRPDDRGDTSRMPLQPPQQNRLRRRVLGRGE